MHNCASDPLVYSQFQQPISLAATGLDHVFEYAQSFMTDSVSLNGPKTESN